jgi:hypothetical protein
MCEWGALMYASREIIQETLANLGILTVLTILLVMIFFALAGQFRGLRSEFESSFYFTETVLMATIPLVASTILTWFVCVEFPSLDLPTCFAVIYYLYMVVMLSPRPSSHPSARAKAQTAMGIWSAGPYVLSVPVVCAVYMIPLVLCPSLHFIVHHNVPMSGSMHRLLDFLNSFLLPLVLTVLAAERHTLYWSDVQARGRVGDMLFSLKIWVAAVLTVTMQTNSFVEEVKAFSGIPEPYASLTTVMAAGFILLAVYLHCMNTGGGTDISSMPGAVGSGVTGEESASTIT